MHIRLFAAAMSIVGTLSITMAAVAEPGPTVRWLMNRDVSLFSFGLYRLGLELRRAEDRLDKKIESFITLNAEYIWDRNRISITFLALKGVEPTEENCRIIFNHIRRVAGISEKGEPFFGGSSFFAKLFDSIGYDNTDAPKNLRQQIDAIIEINGSLWDSDKSITCTGPLLSKEVFVSRPSK